MIYQLFSSITSFKKHLAFVVSLVAALSLLAPL